MPPRSFLGRVTKYSPRPRLDPRENRLTEITAGVLEHVKGFAMEFVEAMLAYAQRDFEMRSAVASGDEAQKLRDRADEMTHLRSGVLENKACPAQVRTQVSTPSGRFVDLEIRLRPNLLRHELDIVFWIEVKHGAPLHGDQLEVYDIEVPSNGLVLVVAPSQSMPELPSEMEHSPLVPWQHLASFVRTRRRRETVGSREHFILGAYADYLKEEGLMDDALATVHALALTHSGEAEAILARLCELSASETRRQWADPEEQHKPYGKIRYGKDWWATYPLRSRGAEEPSASWRGSWLEWGLQDDGGREEDARHMHAFVAGLSTEFEGNPIDLEDNAGWISELRADGFVVYRGDYQRAWRYLYPEQLLVDATLEGQARYLSDWVVRTFSDLIGTPPPH